MPSRCVGWATPSWSSSSGGWRNSRTDRWGRDFSYGRTATVVATETTRLLAFPAAALRELMFDNPAIDRAIRRIAQTRLGSR